jgi:hypothetical protein
LPDGVLALFEAMRDLDVAKEARRAYARLGGALIMSTVNHDARRAYARLGGAVRVELEVRTAAAERDDIKARLGREFARRRDQARQAAEELAAMRTLLAQKDTLFAQEDSSFAQKEKQATAHLSEARAALESTEARAAQLGQALDERTVELAQARERIAAAESALAQRDGDLALHRQRLAAIKRSLSWRLMAPFGEMYRPIRRLQASRLGVKLRAAWRHPLNSRKRKAYRSDRMSEYAAGVTPGPRRPTKFIARLRALARHPFSRKRRRAYREKLRAGPPDPVALPNSHVSVAGSVSPEAAGTDASLFRHHIRNAVNATALGDYVPLSTEPDASSRCDVKLIAYSFRSTTRSPRTTPGGAKASPNGATWRGRSRSSRAITSRACQGSSAITICVS